MIEEKQISTVNETKFLGLIIDNTLSWKGHTEYIKPKLCSACYVMRTVKPYVSQNALKIIYYYYFHAVMSYGLMFWGSSAENTKIFKLQKRMVRIMTGCKSNHSCRSLSVNLKILPVPSQYIFSLLLFVNKNKAIYN
jgi:hypothetical protein